MSTLDLELQGLYTCARIERELKISGRAAEALMRQCPKQTIPGFRRVYVRGSDLARLLDDNLGRRP